MESVKSNNCTSIFNIHGKKLKYIWFLLAILLLLSSCSSKIPVIKIADDENLTLIHFIDVGQADSILIESEGQVLLIDAGNNDDGEKVIEYIKSRGIKKLDYVIGTHPHEDHIGGLDEVIYEFPIGKLFLSDYILPSISLENLLTAVTDRQLQVITPSLGDEYALGNASFTFIAPVKKDYKTKINNYSIGIKLYHGENTFLLTSDAEEMSEMDMAESGIDITADLLKVNHHGAITSTTEIFMNAVRPTYAVISVGADNPYGNPSPSVLKRLQDYNVSIYRTDTMGTIIAISDGKNITFKTEKGGSTN